MKKPGSFDHLSKDLSAYEKKSFLSRVEKQIDSIKPVKNRVSSDQDGEEKSSTGTQLSALQKDLQAVKGLKLISLRLQAYFRSQTLEEAFRTREFDRLRRGLQTGRHPSVHHPKGYLLPLIARELHPVYLKVKLLKRLLNYLWSNNTVLNQYYHWCLAEGYAKKIAKKEIDDFIAADDIKAAILDLTQEQEQRQRMLQAINRYAESLDNQVVNEIKIDLLPLFYLKILFQFPFYDFLKMFGGESIDSLNPTFKNCVSDVCTRELLQLYQLGQLLDGVSLNGDTAPALLSLTLTAAGGGKQEEAIEKESKQIYAKLQECLQHWHKFTQKVPLWKLVLYSQRNIYFTTTLKVPPFRIKPAVVEAFKQKLSSEFSELWAATAASMIEVTENKFIKDGERTKLVFYSSGSSIDASRFGSPCFRHFGTISLLYNFLVHFYPKQLRPVLISLVKVVPRRLPLQQKLVTITNGYENIVRQLKAFDGGLAPETDRGKRLSNIMYRLEKGDINARLPLSELIQATDQEAVYLVEKFLTNLKAGSQTLNEVSKNEGDALKSFLNVYNPHHPQQGKSNSQLVTEACQHQHEFHNFLHYRYQQELLPERKN